VVASAVGDVGREFLCCDFGSVYSGVVSYLTYVLVDGGFVVPVFFVVRPHFLEVVQFFFVS